MFRRAALGKLCSDMIITRRNQHNCIHHVEDRIGWRAKRQHGTSQGMPSLWFDSRILGFYQMEINGLPALFSPNINAYNHPENWHVLLNSISVIQFCQRSFSWQHVFILSSPKLLCFKRKNCFVSSAVEAVEKNNWEAMSSKRRYISRYCEPGQYPSPPSCIKCKLQNK